MIETAIIAVFFVVYLGMILGGLPFLQLDRTGVALLGAIALVSVGALTTSARGAFWGTWPMRKLQCRPGRARRAAGLRSAPR